MGFEGIIRQAAARLQAPMPFPPGCFQHLDNGGCHVQGGGDELVFVLTVIPTQTTEVPVLTNNIPVECWGDCPF